MNTHASQAIIDATEDMILQAYTLLNAFPLTSNRKVNRTQFPAPPTGYTFRTSKTKGTNLENRIPSLGEKSLNGAQIQTSAGLLTIRTASKSGHKPDIDALYTKPACTFPVSDPSTITCFQLSGKTTRTPTLIPRPHRKYLYSIQASAGLYGVDHNTIYLIVLFALHNFPLCCPGFIRTFQAGGKTIFTSGPGSRSTLPLIRQESVIVTASVPPLALWAKVVAAFDNSRQRIPGMQNHPLSPDDGIKILGPYNEPAPIGMVNSPLTRGPYTIRGYYHDDKKISVKKSGNILPDHPSVIDTTVVSIPDAAPGEKICPFVIARNPASSAINLKRHVRSSGLAVFKIPERFELVNALHKTGRKQEWTKPVGKHGGWLCKRHIPSWPQVCLWTRRLAIRSV